VINEPVHLVQEFRDFDFLSPWEGMHAELGGTGKAHGSSKTVK
jgi:NADH-quinone oxidoreductase subunit C